MRRLSLILLLWSSTLAVARAQPHANEEELLDLSLEELLEVEVTSATKSSLALREAPAIITVITAEQIEERGYQSVGEALQSIAGLDLLHDHYQYNLGVRGISPGARAWSRSVKVMLDGQPISFRPSQEVWLGEELVPIEVIERIEIIKGPASVLYGANAYLGVINIITKDGSAVQLGRITALYGAGDHLQDPGASALIGGESGELDAIAAARVRSPRLAGYRLRSVPGQTNTRASELSESGWPMTGSGFAKLQLRSPELGRLALDVHYQQLDRYSEFMDWGAMAHDNLQSLVNMYARLRYGRTFAEILEWNVGAAVAHGEPRERDQLGIAPDFPTHVERSVGYQSFDVFSDLSVQLGDTARISSGVDYTIDDQELLNYYTVRADGTRTLNGPQDARTGDRAFSNVGAYLHGMLSPFAARDDLLATLTLIGGVRFDHQNIYGDSWSRTGGIVQQLPGQLYVKLLYGTSFRAPSSTQLYSNFIAPNDAVGNPELEPERARTHEVAFGGKIYRVLGFELSGYYMQIDNKVEVRPPSATESENPLPQNLGTIESFGLEASLALTAGDLKSYANYSHQRSHSEEPQVFAVRAGETRELEALLYPSHMLKMGFNYRFPKAHFQTNLEARYIGARLGSESNNQLIYGALGSSVQRYHLSSYVLLDLYISTIGAELWSGHETRIGLKVTNLLDADYAYPGHGGFDIPGFTRSFTLTATQNF